jgi:hypothetical protein
MECVAATVEILKLALLKKNVFKLFAWFERFVDHMFCLNVFQLSTNEGPALARPTPGLI